MKSSRTLVCSSNLDPARGVHGLVPHGHRDVLEEALQGARQIPVSGGRGQEGREVVAALHHQHVDVGGQLVPQPPHLLEGDDGGAGPRAADGLGHLAACSTASL